MKSISKYITTIVLGSLLCSCGAAGEFCSGFIGEYSRCVDVTGNDPLGARDLAESWQSGNVGRGIAIAEVGIGMVEAVSGKDLGNVKNVIKGARTGLQNNPNDTSDKAQLIGAAFYGATTVVSQYEQREREKNYQAFLEQNSKYMDPESPFYDPYFMLRYNPDGSKRSFSDVIKDIREMETEEQIGKDKMDLIRYGILNKYEYDNLFGDSTKMESNKQLYLQYLAKLRLMRLDEYYLGNTDANHDKTGNTNISERGSNTDVIKIEGDSLSQNPSVEPLNNVIQIIESTIIDEFKFDSAKLSPKQQSQLNDIAEMLQKNSDLKVMIYGHTCNIGSDTANYNVGLKRAEAAKAYLIERGIDAEKIVTESLGETDPIVGNTNFENRLKNRRITFVVK